MAYLITCSGSKRQPHQLRSGSVDLLYGSNVLGEFRNQLIENSGIQLDWSKTLPAYELYCGVHSKIYTKISPTNWIKPCVEIKILSALFGWIRHTDLIPYYDLKMDKKKGSLMRSPYILWRDSGVLMDFITTSDVDLLSQTYKRAFDGSIPAQRPNDFVFSDRGDCVGNWLEDQLSKEICNE